MAILIESTSAPTCGLVEDGTAPFATRKKLRKTDISSTDHTPLIDRNGGAPTESVLANEPPAPQTKADFIRKSPLNWQTFYAKVGNMMQ
jgi:hypothetical protein